MQVKHNPAAFGPPGAAADAAAGYSIGSTWTNVLDGRRSWCSDPTIGAAVWVEGDPSLQVPSGGILAPQHVVATNDGSGAPMVAHRLYLLPAVVTGLWDMIAIRAETTAAAGAGGRLRFALYGGRDGVPANRIVDLGDVPLDGAAGVQVQYYRYPMRPGVTSLAAVWNGVGSPPRMRGVETCTWALPALTAPGAAGRGAPRYYWQDLPSADLPYVLGSVTDGYDGACPMLTLQRI